jgi:hypothetical protein
MSFISLVSNQTEAASAKGCQQISPAILLLQKYMTPKFSKPVDSKVLTPKGV